MCNLNSKGDSTIKLLTLDSFYKGGTSFLWSEFIQIQNVISQLIYEIPKNFFQPSTSLEQFFQKRYKKNWEIRKFKI